MINKFGILNEAKCFSSGLFQNYLIFIPATKYVKYFSCTIRIDLLKSNGMSEENIKNITKWDNSFTSTLVDHHVLSHINFNGHCLIYNKILITKKSNNSMYFLHTKFMFKKSKHRFWIKELLICISKPN